MTNLPPMERLVFRVMAGIAFKYEIAKFMKTATRVTVSAVRRLQVKQLMLPTEADGKPRFTPKGLELMKEMKAVDKNK